MSIIVKTIDNFKLNLETELVHDVIIKNNDNDKSFKINNGNEKIIDHVRVEQLIYHEDNQDKNLAIASYHEKFNLKTNLKEVHTKIQVFGSEKFSLDKLKLVLSIYGLALEKITEIKVLNEKEFEYQNNKHEFEKIYEISFNYKEINNKIQFEWFDIHTHKFDIPENFTEEEIKNDNYGYKLIIVHDILDNYYLSVKTLTKDIPDNLSINFKIIETVLTTILMTVITGEFSLIPNFPDLKMFIKEYGDDKSCLDFAEGFQKLMKI